MLKITIQSPKISVNTPRMFKRISTFTNSRTLRFSTCEAVKIYKAVNKVKYQTSL